MLGRKILSHDEITDCGRSLQAMREIIGTDPVPPARLALAFEPLLESAELLYVTLVSKMSKP
jgi:hypoxanthine phosphoribosyltransferase